MLASILLLDEDGRRLRHGAAPSLPDAYNEAIDGLEIGPAAGSCGTAAHRGERVVVGDVAHDPLWADYRELAAPHGLAACWSTPIFSTGGELLGTFAMYYREPREPRAGDLEFVDEVTQTAALAIERSRLLEAERAARAQLESLFAEAPGMLAVLRGPEHVFERANSAYVEAVGGRQLLGLPMRVALPELDDALHGLLDSVYATGEPVLGSEQLVRLDRRGDGTLEDRWFNFAYQPLRESDGSVGGVAVNAVDVSEQVLARRRVEAAEQRLRLATAAGGVGTWSWDIARDRVYADERISSLFGVDPESGGRGLPLQEFVEGIVEEDRERVAREIEAAVASGGAYECEYRVRGADGRIRWLLARGRVERDEQGAAVRFPGAVVDVSEQVEAERALRIARQQVGAAVSAGRIGIWTWDAAADLVVADATFAGLFALDADEVAGGVPLAAVVAAIEEDDRPRVEAGIARALAEGADFDEELRVRDAAGEIAWVLGRGSVELGADGRPVGLVAMAIDVTREKRATERLEYLARAGEALGGSLDVRAALKQIAELAVPALADFCVFDVVEDGAVVQLAAVHRSPERSDFPGRIARHVAPLDHPWHPASLAMKRGKTQRRTRVDDGWLRRIAVDDDHRELLASLGIRSLLAVPLLVQGAAIGAITFGFAGSGRRHSADDVVLAEELAARAALALDNARLLERERQAREVAERRAHATAAFTFVGDGVVLADAAGVVRSWNPAATRITGIPEEEIVGRRLDEAVDGWAEIADRVPVTPAAADEPRRPESLPLRLGGRELWVSISGTSFEGGTVYAFADVTAERSLDHMRAELIATVSHELRTPLAAVYGAAATLRRSDLDLDEDGRGQFLEMIHTQTERLAAIVEEILIASRLEAGQIQLVPAPVDPSQLAREVLDSVRAADGGPAIELHAPPAAGPVVVDAQRVTQVLRNLVENAVRYSDGEPRVDVRVESDGLSLRFAVSDRGIGIDQAEQRRIFEKFYRVDSNMSRGVGGTGLGLYICAELVRRMDGRLWVESTPGHGSTFSFEVPARAA